MPALYLHRKDAPNDLVQADSAELEGLLHVPVVSAMHDFTGRARLLGRRAQLRRWVDDAVARYDVIVVSSDISAIDRMSAALVDRALSAGHRVLRYVRGADAPLTPVSP